MQINRLYVKKLLLATLLPLSLTLTACNGNMSGGDEINPIDAREDIMKNWKDAMGIMGNMLKQPDTFDAAVFQEQAKFLAEDATTPWQHFNNTEERIKDAEPVWITDPEGFRTEAENFEQLTAQLNSAAQTATSASDVSDAFSEVSASCKSCHKTFKPKK